MPVVDWSQYISTATFAPVVEGILGVFPAVICTVIPLMVIRKGWEFLKGNIYSA